MAEPKHLLNSVALAACELGYGHCHMVSAKGTVIKNAAVENSEAFSIVRNWKHVELVLFKVSAYEDAVTWLYVQCNDKGQPLGEAIQFVSLNPDLIRSTQSLH